MKCGVVTVKKKKKNVGGGGGQRLTYLDICIAESGDALDFATGDSRRLQRQHGLKNGVELCYARHGCDVRRPIDTAYSSQYELCL